MKSLKICKEVVSLNCCIYSTFSIPSFGLKKTVIYKPAVPPSTHKTMKPVLFGHLDELTSIPEIAIASV